MDYNKKVLEYIFKNEYYTDEEKSVMFYSLLNLTPNVAKSNKISELPTFWRMFLEYAAGHCGIDNITDIEKFFSRCAMRPNHIKYKLYCLTLVQKIKYVWLVYLFLSHMKIFKPSEFQMKYARDTSKEMFAFLDLSETLQDNCLQDFDKMYNAELKIFVDSID